MTASYDNCKMLDKESNFMSFVDQNKMDWYLNKNLADKIDEKTFKLNFIPKGNGVSLNYYKSPNDNQCVCCGSKSDLTKHHVLPYRFKKYFPLEYKPHTSFDILLLCETCHTKYEIQANKFQNELIKKFNADKIIYNKEYRSILNTISSLLKNQKSIPSDRQVSMLSNIKNYFKNDSITFENMTSYLKPVSSKEEIEKSIQNIILEMGGFFNFIVLWRKHFLEIMNPKYLSSDWIDSIEDSKTLNSL